MRANDPPVVFPPALCAGPDCGKLYEKICLQCLKALCAGHFPQGSHQCREPEDRSVFYRRPERRPRRRKPAGAPAKDCPEPCPDGCANPAAVPPPPEPPAQL